MTLQSVIELLRWNVAVRVSNRVLPDAGNMKLLVATIRTHATLVELKRRRDIFR